MLRNAKGLAFTVAVALLGVGSAAFAHASLVALDDVANAALVPSAPPALLGPINELGRNGWQCVPEQAARAKRARFADVPVEDSP